MPRQNRPAAVACAPRAVPVRRAATAVAGPACTCCGPGCGHQAPEEPAPTYAVESQPREADGLFRWVALPRGASAAGGLPALAGPRGPAGAAPELEAAIDAAVSGEAKSYAEAVAAAAAAFPVGPGEAAARLGHESLVALVPMLRDPIGQLARALDPERGEGPSLRWVVRWSDPASGDVGAAWRVSRDPSAMATLALAVPARLPVMIAALMTNGLSLSFTPHGTQVDAYDARMRDRAADLIRAAVPRLPPLAQMLEGFREGRRLLAADAKAAAAAVAAPGAEGRAPAMARAVEGMIAQLDALDAQERDAREGDRGLGPAALAARPGALARALHFGA